MVAAQSNQRMILPQGAHQVGTPVPLEKPDIHFGRRGGSFGWPRPSVGRLWPPPVAPFTLDVVGGGLPASASPSTCLATSASAEGEANAYNAACGKLETVSDLPSMNFARFTACATPTCAAALTACRIRARPWSFSTPATPAMSSPAHAPGDSADVDRIAADLASAEPASSCSARWPAAGRLDRVLLAGGRVFRGRMPQRPRVVSVAHPYRNRSPRQRSKHPPVSDQSCESIGRSFNRSATKRRRKPVPGSSR